MTIEQENWEKNIFIECRNDLQFWYACTLWHMHLFIQLHIFHLIN